MENKDIKIKHPRYCLVPQCNSSTKKTPGKKCISIPMGSSAALKKKRKLWLRAMRRSETDISENTKGIVCEDHFNLEEDMVNYMKFKLMGGYIYLKDHVVPHIFDCQAGRKIRLPVERTTTTKRARKVLVNTLLNKTAEDEEHEQQPESLLKSSHTIPDFQVIQQVLPEDMVPSKYNIDDKCTQTVSVVQRTVAVQCRPPYRSKFVQTTDIICKEYGMISVACSPPKFRTSPPPPMISKIKSIAAIYSTDSESTDSNNSNYPRVNFSSNYSSASSNASVESSTFIKDRIKTISVERSLYLAVHKSKCYLGIPEDSYFVVNLLQKHTKCAINDIYVTLKKIKTNLPFELIGDDFGISNSEAAKIFQKTAPRISACLKTLIFWPSKESIKLNLPIAFRTKYNNVQCIIDCFEIEIEKPSNPITQAATWSEYKKTNTIKYLISSTPDGVINFISNGFGGRTTDVTIVEKSEFLRVLPRNCSVMADRGFKRIDVLLHQLDCKLIRPPSVKAGVKSTKEEVMETKRIAALRIHIERVIRRMREFKILKPHACVNTKLIKCLDHLVIICSALVNLQPSIIKK